ncbi:MAG TPA: hypothetical protein VGM88_34460 [Kofleriaceae bacterium]|jgi:hypothetical protein
MKTIDLKTLEQVTGGIEFPEPPSMATIGTPKSYPTIPIQPIIPPAGPGGVRIK